MSALPFSNHRPPSVYFLPQSRVPQVKYVWPTRPMGKARSKEKSVAVAPSSRTGLGSWSQEKEAIFLQPEDMEPESCTFQGQVWLLNSSERIIGLNGRLGVKETIIVSKDSQIGSTAQKRKRERRQKVKNWRNESNPVWKWKRHETQIRGLRHDGSSPEKRKRWEMEGATKSRTKEIRARNAGEMGNRLQTSLPPRQR